MIWDLGDQKVGAKMDQNSGPFRGQEPLWLQGCREPMRFSMGSWRMLETSGYFHQRFFTKENGDLMVINDDDTLWLCLHSY